MNIVFGGSFNPPTLAHKAIVDKLIEAFNPQNLIVIPTGTSYKRKELIDFNHRENMLKIMMPYVVVSDIEEKNKEYLGTLNTLDKLSKDYDDLYFVMGADNILGIKTWIRYEELLERYNFIIMKRDGLDIEGFILNEIPCYKDHFTIIDINIPISSTKVRDDIDLNKGFLDDGVYSYIKKNNLY